MHSGCLWLDRTGHGSLGQAVDAQVGSDEPSDRRHPQAEDQEVLQTSRCPLYVGSAEASIDVGRMIPAISSLIRS